MSGRYVDVRYFTPVHVTVNLDAEDPDDAVVRVQHGDSLVTRIDDKEAIEALGSGDVLEFTYYDDYDGGCALDPAKMSSEDRQKALTLAEEALWPQWEGY